MARSPARRRRLLVHKAAGRGDRPTDYPRSGPAYDSERREPEASDAEDELAEDGAAPADDAPDADDEQAAGGEPEADEPDLLPAPAPAPTANRRPRALPAVRSNPDPLPEPLPPRLDEVVRRLREDLLTLGGPAAALADEICARHRDRLREALGLSE
ncbi:hypothetical protein [Alienimonas sp. DA493]|uniref:hypothetical protein n=1 Tax=Alienimonas sp. DA493 TaxID=3373605 RepID=UPI0037541AF5